LRGREKKASTLPFRSRSKSEGRETATRGRRRLLATLPERGNHHHQKKSSQEEGEKRKVQALDLRKRERGSLDRSPLGDKDTEESRVYAGGGKERRGFSYPLPLSRVGKTQECAYSTSTLGVEKGKKKEKRETLPCLFLYPLWGGGNGGKGEGSIHLLIFEGKKKNESLHFYSLFY